MPLTGALATGVLLGLLVLTATAFIGTSRRWHDRRHATTRRVLSCDHCQREQDAEHGRTGS
ncbi:hypothetical protein [Saccharothrix sp. HUAS TT1]|uniref:hypothetical protein n=1 Tax=unclassified Saccharothrix TaxID=2593673 RepID=UPI00345C61E7